MRSTTPMGVYSMCPIAYRQLWSSPLKHLMYAFTVIPTCMGAGYFLEIYPWTNQRPPCGGPGSGLDGRLGRHPV